MNSTMKTYRKVAEVTIRNMNEKDNFLNALESAGYEIVINAQDEYSFYFDVIKQVSEE